MCCRSTQDQSPPNRPPKTRQHSAAAQLSPHPQTRLAMSPERTTKTDTNNPSFEYSILKEREYINSFCPQINADARSWEEVSFDPIQSHLSKSAPSAKNIFVNCN